LTEVENEDEGRRRLGLGPGKSKFPGNKKLKILMEARTRTRGRCRWISISISVSIASSISLIAFSKKKKKRRDHVHVTHSPLEQFTNFEFAEFVTVSPLNTVTVVVSHPNTDHRPTSSPTTSVLNEEKNLKIRVTRHVCRSCAKAPLCLHTLH